MKKPFCDKCGKEISKMGECNNMSLSGLRIHGQSYNNIDLCNGCAKKLVMAVEKVLTKKIINNNN